jgi:hypothetical protein
MLTVKKAATMIKNTVMSVLLVHAGRPNGDNALFATL